MLSTRWDTLLCRKIYVNGVQKKPIERPDPLIASTQDSTSTGTM